MSLEDKILKSIAESKNKNGSYTGVYFHRNSQYQSVIEPNTCFNLRQKCKKDE